MKTVMAKNKGGRPRNGRPGSTVVTVAFTLPPDIVAMLRERAAQDDRSMSMLVRRILREYFDARVAQT